MNGLIENESNVIEMVFVTDYSKESVGLFSYIDPSDKL